MRSASVFAFGLIVLSSDAPAEELNHFQTLYDEWSVETRTLSIRLGSLDEDVHFSVTLHDKETGLERRHEFDGQGSNEAFPYMMEQNHYCDTSVILLTVQYPWRHALPQYVRVLETYAFRSKDFEFIDVTFGPLTDIALADNTAYEASDLEMLPPIRVRCLAEGNGKPFEFVEEETK